MELRLQVLITQRCNAVCTHCDKGVGLAKMPDIEMTGEDMRRCVDAIKTENLEFKRVSISGGEPIINPHLQEILNEAAKIETMYRCRVLTNGLNSTKERREAIKLPDERFAWAPGYLDDLDDPKSGKNKRGVRYRDAVHWPFWISPADLGYEAKFENCGVRSFCGRGFDNNGFSMCGQAPILGRVLGINPYPAAGVSVREHIETAMPEICKHCMYGLKHNPKKRDKNDLFKHVTLEVAKGNLPPMSETYTKVFGDKLVQLTL